MDMYSAQQLAASLDRSSYILAGALRDIAKQNAEETRKTVLLAGGVFGLVFSVFLLILLIIVKGHA